MKAQKTKLTNWQVYALFMSINTWDAKNKVAKEPVLDLNLFKKLFTIKDRFKVTLEALESAKVQMADLVKDKQTSEYDIPLLTEDDFVILVDGVETYEIFGWVKA